MLGFLGSLTLVGWVMGTLVAVLLLVMLLATCLFYRPQEDDRERNHLAVEENRAQRLRPRLFHRRHPGHVSPLLSAGLQQHQLHHQAHLQHLQQAHRFHRQCHHQLLQQHYQDFQHHLQNFQHHLQHHHQALHHPLQHHHLHHAHGGLH
ncbi:histidine-rich carboxyl terminus protein 1 [Octodon degus]|uniref:Histidine-rich carboxyl terminus protein 1 n=1 Tax=Octodon degus TaxID=10160 RepID=A0A6P6EIG5_OCTDE|nr:histidine-rich carboxyl terminus protein 1 [Octodon degus]